jgi:flagellar biosynthesis GTPase FlhF
MNAPSPAVILPDNSNSTNKGCGDDSPEDIIEKQELKASADKKAASRRAGQAFIESLMQAECQDIPNSGGMQVLKNIYRLESGESKDIVIRACTILFWTECIRVVNTPKRRYRVAAMGTTGTGKTTSTAILIRMLLEKTRRLSTLFEQKTWLGGTTSLFLMVLARS